MTTLLARALLGSCRSVLDIAFRVPSHFCKPFCRELEFNALHAAQPYKLMALILGKPLMQSLTRRRIAFLIALTAVAVLMFACTKKCEAQISSRRGLARHRNGCSIYKTAAALRTEQRRFSKISTDAKGEPSGRRHLDADVQASSGLDNVRASHANFISPINNVL